MDKKIKIRMLAMGTIFFWAIAFPFSKVAMVHFSPYALGFIRVCIASVTLLIIGAFTGIRKPELKDIPWLFMAGACGFGIYLFAFNRGIMTLTSASSSIIIAITPILTAVEASKLYGEKINRLGWTMLFTAFSGVLVMMLWNGAFSINKGIFWTLGASLVFSFYNILNRKLSKMGYKAIEIVTYSMISAVVCLSPFSVKAAGELSSAPLQSILVVLMLGITSSALAYYLWSMALTMTDNTSEVTNFGFLTPFVATLLGSVILKELPNMGTVIGGIIIIASIVVFSRKGRA